MIKKGVLSLVLAALIVFGVATAASAAPWKDKGQGNKWKFKKPNTVKVNVQLADINSHWAEKPIRSMSSWGIISGYPDFTFRPNATVSKYEALMMITRATGYEADKNLSWNNSLEAMMDFAVDEGILTKDESEDLAGGQPAKRYEVAVWAVRAMGLGEDNDKLLFNDINEIPSYARPYVSSMYRYQYMVGYPGKVFAPNKPVTRAELASIIYRILEAGPVDDNSSDDSSSTDAVEISSLAPADGSDNVGIGIDNLTAKFNVRIEAVDTLDDVKEGIEIKSENGKVVDIDEVSIDGRYLKIVLDEELEGDTTYKVAIDDDIIKADDSDEVFEGLSGSQWEFNTGDVEKVEIENLDPENGEEDVDWEDTNVLRATFNCDIEADSLVNAVVVYNKDDNEEVDIHTVEIDGDELVITLGEELESNDTYEVTIKDGYLSSEESGEEFNGLDGEDWSFTTRE